MREKLKDITGKRIEVFAEVGRFGKKAGFQGREVPTVCLVNLTDKAGNKITDHLWIIVGIQIKKLRFRVGEKLKFIARSRPYLKGYKEKTVDFGLFNPTKFVKLTLPGETDQRKSTPQISLFE